MTNNDRLALDRKITNVEADLAYLLRRFGDHLAEREGYKRHRDIDAIHFFLIQRHGWLPKDVRHMSNDDLRFVLEEEMSSWTLPPEARR